MNREESDMRRVKEGAWVVAWRWGMALLGAALSGVALYATMWVKLNAPTRFEFNELSKGVQSLREDLIRRESQQIQLSHHEKRIAQLEEESRRRYPAIRRETP